MQEAQIEAQNYRFNQKLLLEKEKLQLEKDKLQMELQLKLKERKLEMRKYEIEVNAEAARERILSEERVRRLELEQKYGLSNCNKMK